MREKPSHGTSSSTYKWFCRLTCVALLAVAASAQVIDFDQNGLHYKTLTRNGLTIMFAPLPAHVRGYAILQVAVANGSAVPWTVKPQDFQFSRVDGVILRASDPNLVVDSLLEKGSRADVIKLITTYEGGIYGNPQFKTTNGYESRRQNALGFGSEKLNAAAAASAIALVRTRLGPGASTDGAVFFENGGKPLGDGKLTIRAASSLFEFPVEPATR